MHRRQSDELSTELLSAVDGTPMLLPTEHAQRWRIADEVHARPSSALHTPSQVTHIACLIDRSGREVEAQHITDLCRLFGSAAPDPSTDHFETQLGELTFAWERHGEFSGYTFFHNGATEASPAEALPPAWLKAIPGMALVAIRARVLRAAEEAPTAAFMEAHFGTNVVAGSSIADGAGIALTDFRIHDDGYSRMVLLDQGLTARQAGRTIQRLLEIEVYRMLALLALPVAREQLTVVSDIERGLSALTRELTSGTADDERLLHLITALAGRVENEIAASQFRLGACRAYSELVLTRIAELRERRLSGFQTIGEFMERRFRPAVATCATVELRLQGLSERVARTSTLLSTRVDIARERQNHQLLASLDRRAKIQLRLQQAVEGLSLAAIVYYVVGLIGYLAKGAKARGLSVDVDATVAVSIPVVAALAFSVIHRARRR